MFERTKKVEGSFFCLTTLKLGTSHPLQWVVVDDKELSVQLQILDKHPEYLHYFTKNSNIVTEVYQKMSLIPKPELQDLLDFRIRLQFKLR